MGKVTPQLSMEDAVGVGVGVGVPPAAVAHPVSDNAAIEKTTTVRLTVNTWTSEGQGCMRVSAEQSDGAT